MGKGRGGEDMSTNKPAGGAQFTPGPWVVRPDSTIESKDGVTIASFVDNEADMSIIAAAPAMYEALQALLALIGDEDLPDNGELSGASICDFARSALAQAEGR